MKKVLLKPVDTEAPYGSVVYIAIGETYDGGIGIYNRSKPVAAFFGRAAAQKAAQDNSSGPKMCADGYVETHKVLDKPHSENPAEIHIAVGVQHDGGMGTNNRQTNLGAFFSEAAARQVARENSSGPWYEPTTGWVVTYKISDSFLAPGKS